MIDRFLSKTGVGLALLFLVAELSYINTKSLEYMLGSDGFEVVFGVIGAIAFSVVTVVIMRLGKQPWLKLAFPLFDIALAFCGFNLGHANDLLENPIRFALSIFLSAFAGFITYSLGQINAEQHPVEDTNILKGNLVKLETDLQVTLEKLQVTQTDFVNLQSQFTEKQETEKLLQTDLDKLKGNFEVTLNKLEVTLKLLEEQRGKAEKYERSYYMNERARILKKAEKNRTEEENKILMETN